MTVVLIVEDNPRNLKLVRDILEHAGYRTLEAATAEDGLALARAQQPELVLMDVQLPGMDGVEALARLRADPATSGIRRRRGDRVRDEGRTATASSRRASTATSRSRSASGSSRVRWRSCSTQAARA